MQVIDEASNTWTPLTQSGNLFVGNVMVNSGKIQIAAKFPDSEKYWTLLEYN